jgi:hypothetical protein
MEELINISNFCNSLLVKHGQNIIHCSAMYIKSDDIIEFKMKYHNGNKKNIITYQYDIPNFNFLITDTDVLVNKSAIDTINIEIEKRINIIEMKYGD